MQAAMPSRPSVLYELVLHTELWATTRPREVWLLRCRYQGSGQPPLAAQDCRVSAESGACNIKKVGHVHHHAAQAPNWMKATWPKTSKLDLPVLYCSLDLPNNKAKPEYHEWR